MNPEPKYHLPLAGGFEDVLEAIADERRPPVQTVGARPFLKWVGGKRSLLSSLTPRIPADYTKYHEPFVGGGALFFSAQPKAAYLSDINFHLILTFQAVRDEVNRLISTLKDHASHHNKDYYLRMRERLFHEKDAVKIAALVIYLNKTCYNGLYRVNRQGKFNVPMGSYKDPTIVDEDNLRNCAKVLRDVEIRQHDFTQLTPHKRGFYYLDPPYDETYDGYTGTGFGPDHHERLAAFCRAIHKAGGYFMVSNSDTELIRRLYRDYTLERVAASRSVSCKGHQRGKENELLIRNYE